MSQPEEPHHQPQPLTYRSPTDEPLPPVGFKRLNGCALVVLATWGAMAFGSIALASILRGRRYLGLISAVLMIGVFVVVAMKWHSSGDPKRRYYAAGMWIGIGLSVLLVGLCSGTFR